MLELATDTSNPAAISNLAVAVSAGLVVLGVIATAIAGEFTDRSRARRQAQQAERDRIVETARAISQHAILLSSRGPLLRRRMGWRAWVPAGTLADWLGARDLDREVLQITRELCGLGPRLSGAPEELSTAAGELVSAAVDMGRSSEDHEETFLTALAGYHRQLRAYEAGQLDSRSRWRWSWRPQVRTGD